MPDAGEQLIQLRYEDSDGELRELNAAELAAALQGLVEFVSEAAKAGALGDAPPPNVMVRPLREGSFILQAVLQWAQENPEVAAGIGTSVAGNVVVAVKVGLRKLRGEVTDFEYLDNGNVKLRWADNTAQEVPAAAWKLLDQRRRRTKSALAKILAPMASQVDTLTLTSSASDGNDEGETVEVAGRDDYRAAIAPEPEEELPVETFEVEGTLRRIDFQPKAKWRVATNRGTKSATVEDEDFLRRVDEGLPLKKTDIFRFRIREETVQKARRTTRWVIEEVLGHRPGSTDDDNDAVATSDAVASIDATQD